MSYKSNIIVLFLVYPGTLLSKVFHVFSFDMNVWPHLILGFRVRNSKLYSVTYLKKGRKYDDEIFVVKTDALDDADVCIGFGSMRQ